MTARVVARRGLLAALAAGVVAVVVGVVSRGWPRGKKPAAWRGFRRVRPWNDADAHVPHDWAG